MSTVAIPSGASIVKISTVQEERMDLDHSDIEMIGLEDDQVDDEMLLDEDQSLRVTDSPAILNMEDEDASADTESVKQDELLLQQSRGQSVEPTLIVEEIHDVHDDAEGEVGDKPGLITKTEVYSHLDRVKELEPQENENDENAEDVHEKERFRKDETRQELTEETQDELVEVNEDELQLQEQQAEEVLIVEHTVELSDVKVDFPNIGVILQFNQSNYVLVSADSTNQLVDVVSNEPLLEDYTVLSRPLETFFSILRSIFVDQVSDDVELALNLSLVGLFISEDNIYCSEVTFYDFVSQYAGLSTNDNVDGGQTPLTVELTIQTRFINRFNHISALIGEGHGFVKLSQEDELSNLAYNHQVLESGSDDGDYDGTTEEADDAHVVVTATATEESEEEGEVSQAVKPELTQATEEKPVLQDVNEAAVDTSVEEAEKIIDNQDGNVVEKSLPSLAASGDQARVSNESVSPSAGKIEEKFAKRGLERADEVNLSEAGIKRSKTET
ncbi:hypothetical protein V1514DRAFT_328324 [Lipomyces japonicus]|uniref:uncharacterized protein n=1 Tax=Lipomyces japonicus TaxID=56871 RepID=UPI0034CD34A8